MTAEDKVTLKIDLHPRLKGTYVSGIILDGEPFDCIPCRERKRLERVFRSPLVLAEVIQPHCEESYKITISGREYFIEPAKEDNEIDFHYLLSGGEYESELIRLLSDFRIPDGFLVFERLDCAEDTDFLDRLVELGPIEKVDGYSVDFGLIYSIEEPAIENIEEEA